MLLIVSCEVQETLQINYSHKKITKWSKLSSSTTTKISILPIQLIKKALSVEFQGSLFQPTNVCISLSIYIETLNHLIDS